jgi:hypothetical protein
VRHLRRNKKRGKDSFPAICEKKMRTHGMLRMCSTAERSPLAADSRIVEIWNRRWQRKRITP